jgi:hypothetical protein
VNPQISGRNAGYVSSMIASAEFLATRKRRLEIPHAVDS